MSNTTSVIVDGDVQSDQAGERLSDLLDGYIDPAGIDEILVSDESSKTWYRYNLVRSVLKKEHSAFSSYEFGQSIYAKILDESEATEQPDQDCHYDRKIPQPNNVVSLWRKLGGGFAIAASVAFVMIFSVQLMEPIAKDRLAGEVRPVSIDDSMPVNVALQPMLASEAEAAEQARLDEIQYLLNRMNQSRLNANEQFVDGEVTFSKVVRLTNMNELEKRIRNMKKPSDGED